MSNEGALANLDVESALAEIRSGVIAKQIAVRYGVTADGLRQALQRRDPEGYKDAVAQQAATWVYDSAQEMQELPADALCIARARARGEFNLKLAGKVNKDFADKSLNLNVNVTVDQTIQFDAGALLDSVRVIDQARDVGATMGATAKRIEDNSDDNQ
jgi:hypothetical protein